MMKRREFCRQFAIVGGSIVLAPLIKGCAPYVDPTATSDGQLPTTAPPTATSTPNPTQTPQFNGDAGIRSNPSPAAACGKRPN